MLRISSEHTSANVRARAAVWIYDILHTLRVYYYVRRTLT